MRRPQRSMSLICWSLLLGLTVAQLRAQGVEVSATIIVNKSLAPADKKHKDKPSAANVVVWLSPLKPVPSASILPARQTPYRLVQKNKMFTPHLLVVPTGTSVQFPNEDPFFHNVFSLFNGKRFDLGLYEPGTSRSVRFDREGASYIFCNIHPEMGAVIVTLSTPYYAVSARDGSIHLQNVPPGSYRLHVWAENVPIDRLDALGRNVEIGTQNVDLGAISLETSGNVMNHHKNKFGESYAPTAKVPY